MLLPRPDTSKLSAGLFVSPGGDAGVKARHKLELEEVAAVQTVNPLLGGGVVDLAGADIAIQHGIGKAQIVLVGFAAQAVDGNLVHQNVRQTQITAHLLDLIHRQVGHRAEISGGVTVAGGIAHPVLRKVAGVDHTAVPALAHGVDRRHADAGGQIGEALGRELQTRGHGVSDALYRVLDVHHIVLNSKMPAEQLGHINVMLHAVGHEHADDPILAQGFDTKGGGNRAVLSAGDAQHGVAIGSVFRKEVPDPLDTGFCGCFYIKHGSFSYDVDLAGAHGFQRSFVPFRADAGAAGGVHIDFPLVEAGLEQQGVGDHTDVGTQSHQRDIKVLFCCGVLQKLRQNQRAKGGLFHYHRAAPDQCGRNFRGELPARRSLDAVGVLVLMK